MRGFSRSSEVNVYETFADLMLCVVVCFLLMILLIFLVHQKKIVEARFLNQKMSTSEQAVFEQLAILNEQKRPGEDAGFLIEQLKRLREPQFGKLPDDPMIQRWESKLRRIEELLVLLNPLERMEPLPADYEANLAELADLIGEDDPDLMRWRVKVEKVAQLRLALAPLDLVQPAPEEAELNLVALEELVGSQPEDVQRWRSKLNRIEELIAILEVLEIRQTEPDQAAEFYAELAGLIGTDVDYMQRWNNKITAIAAMRTSLAALDKSQPIAPDAEENLELLMILVGEEDESVSRWTEKLERVNELKAFLAHLDVQTPVLPDTASKLRELAILVSDEDSDVDRWQSIMVVIASLKHRLKHGEIPVASITPQLRQDVAQLEMLLSLEDPIVSAWTKHLKQVDYYISQLEVLDDELSPIPWRTVFLNLVNLQKLVGAEDRAIRRWHNILRRNQRPGWASEGNRDQYGKWAVLPLPGGTKLRLRHVKRGEFTQGNTTSAQVDPMEVPRQVTLSRSFWMAEHELTQEQWEAAEIGVEDPSFTDGDNLPVHRVQLNEVVSLLDRLNELINERIGGVGRIPLISIPTEAQWEYACRAGSNGPYGAVPSGLEAAGEQQLALQAWYEGNVNRLQPVATRMPNAWGLHDMHGNVSEWVRDAFAPYEEGPVKDPIGKEGPIGSLRGGGFRSPAEDCAAYRRFRVADMEQRRLPSAGVRLVLLE
jgi:formylglycine-generating enzyme required for sulfatase activity